MLAERLPAQRREHGLDLGEHLSCLERQHHTPAVPRAVRQRQDRGIQAGPVRQERSPVGVKALRHDDCAPDAELLDCTHTAGVGREAFTILQQCLRRSAELRTDPAHRGDLVMAATALPVAGQEQPVDRSVCQQPDPGSDSFVQHQRGASVRHHARAEYDGRVAVLQTVRIGHDPAKGSRSHSSAAHLDRTGGRSEGNTDAGDRANDVPAPRRSIKDTEPHCGTVPPISTSVLGPMSLLTIAKQPLFVLALTMSTTYDDRIAGELIFSVGQRVARNPASHRVDLSSGPRNLGL